MSKLTTIQLFAEIDFSASGLDIDDATNSKAVLVGADGTHFILKGKNLSYSNGMIDDGVITEIRITTESGKLYETAKGFSFIAGSVQAASNDEFYINLATRLIEHGLKYIGSDFNDFLMGSDVKDIMTGGKGNDSFTAYGGKDLLTGGKGSDTFVLTENFGKDTITDFDADGGEGLQDFIDATYPGDIAVHKSGRDDTEIKFEDGSVLLLLDVKASHIDASDFI